MKNNKKLICVCIVFVLIAGVFYVNSSSSRSDELVFSEGKSTEVSPQESLAQNNLESNATEETNTTGHVLGELSEETDAPENEADGCCYVCGAVKKPGVYEFTNGQRVNDLIMAAGGLKKDASPESLNLAEQVTDGQKIYVPTTKEAETGDFESNNESSSQSSEENQLAQGTKINLNTADKETLMTLPGIGEAKANSIIAYREEHGSFQNIEEMKNVEGIKDGVFSKVQDLICVQ